jgi:hypothetical protein
MQTPNSPTTYGALEKKRNLPQLAETHKKARQQTNFHRQFPPVGAVASIQGHPLMRQTDTKSTQHSPTRCISPTFVEKDVPPISPNPVQTNALSAMYGSGIIARAKEITTTPGGSSQVRLYSGASAHISTLPLGEGGETSAYVATYRSPGGNYYPAAAIHTLGPSKYMHTHAKEFGNLASIDLGNSDYVLLTLKGTTLRAAVEKIRPCECPEKYKLAFLLSHLPSLVHKLELIEASGHAHEDIKPDNIVIWKPGEAGPIDMRNLPKQGDRKKTFSTHYVSPGKNLVRMANSSSDVFAIGKSISRGLAAFEPVFSEIPGLTELIQDLSKPRDERPTLTILKSRLEGCLEDFKRQNSDTYETIMAGISKAFF